MKALVPSPIGPGLALPRRSTATFKGKHMWVAPGPSSLARYSGRSERNERLPASGRGEGDLENHVLGTRDSGHLVLPITLTLPSPGVPGEGSCRARGLPFAACGKPAGF